MGSVIFVLHPVLKEERGVGGASVRRSDCAQLEEAVSLARGVNNDKNTHRVVDTLSHIRPATFFGRGKMEALGATFKEHSVEVVIVNHALTPVQQRNLERAWQVKVLDRTGLILEIFAARARTREGRLQVDLARLTYQKSRLVRTWTHLERQRGALGFVGGPGETQIEADRRLIQKRITQLRRRLETVRRTRALHRKPRQKAPWPTIVLVGYTNAGKSTLFNHITGASVMADDRLFATLDPTIRNIDLPSGRRVVLSDTVGFISNLPTHLVAAFRATLEEIVESDIILHVQDSSHPDMRAQAADVVEVLGSFGINEPCSGSGQDEMRKSPKIVQVLNKIDRLPHDSRETGSNKGIPISAMTGEGVDALLNHLDTLLGAQETIISLDLGPADEACRAWLYRHSRIVSQHNEAGRIFLEVAFSSVALGRFQKRFPQISLSQADFSGLEASRVAQP
ncbi:MAG: GTPase HflX [Parvularculales bacterium]